MDQHTLDKLQFDKVKEQLAGCCACTLGKKLARGLEPAKKTSIIRRWFDQVQQMENADIAVGLPPFGGIRDVRSHIRSSGLPAGIEAYDLAQVGETLAATTILSKWFASVPEELTAVSALGKRIGDFGPLAAKIDKAIDPRGKVRNDASPRLADIRHRIDVARTEIDQVIERVVRKPRVVRMLQYPNATFHDDRRVLPLKAEHRGHLKGIIHRSSDSGSTLFVEPAEAVELNNTIVALQDQQAKEIARILSQLSYLVHQNSEEILKTLEAIAVIDLISAKVRYMKTRKAICPEIRDDRMLDMRQARHPLLLELSRAAAESGDKERAIEVVPIDVRLGDDFDLLVITGPNTGGKTVTLKTIGLLAVMTQCGIPIPTDPGSRMPVFRDVFIDVGDEQSIEQSLSTFSSHLSNVLKVLKQADEHSLVLLDELGSGTDPDEGAAIGRSIIEELLRCKCSAVVTTHLSALKAVAFTADRVDNACVEFDVESLRPTFHLRIGEPGNSNAITIAHRLGMSKRMVKSARTYLSGKNRALNKAIRGTLDSRRQAERARLDANQALLDAEQQRIRYENELRDLEQQRQQHMEWMEWLNSLNAGDEVYVRKFERTAKIVRLQFHRQTALVNSGAMDMEVHLNELSCPKSQE